MATKKIAAKIAKTKEEASPKKSGGKYFYAVGKRKTSIAQVKIYPSVKAEKGIIINSRAINDYFGVERLRDTALAPIMNTGFDGKFDVVVKVSGGGISSQAEAIRLGMSRALIKFDETLRKSLKGLGFLTRDARIVERKKPGLKKARRAPQWAKR